MKQGVNPGAAARMDRCLQIQIFEFMIWMLAWEGMTMLGTRDRMGALLRSVAAGALFVGMTGAFIAVTPLQSGAAWATEGGGMNIGTIDGGHGGGGG
ncbi:MAG: hypothetical protein KDK01_09270, partial [Rhodobacteraceae bacterium]|nr:hypothetical protein [Paracoccaceae bacterium]